MSKWTSQHTGIANKHVNTLNGARHHTPRFELNEV